MPRHNSPVHLAQLVELVERVRGARGKGEKTRLIALFLRQSRGPEAQLAALYLAGTLRQGKIGIGWRMIQAAMVDGEPAGDLPTLAEADAIFEQIAAEKGAGSNDRRIAALRALMMRSAPAVRDFLARLLIGEVRQGADEGLILDAIAEAAALPPSEVRRAFMYSGNLGEIAQAALEHGEAGLSRYDLRVLTPIAPMLAQTAEDVPEAIERLGEAAFEYKLDGARIQVHKSGGDVRVFTRQLQDVTARVPEVVEWTRALDATELVLEGETLALREDGRPQPFQITMRRLGRSRDIESARRELPLSSFFFDCLYRTGEGALTSAPYRERVRILARTVAAGQLMPSLITGDPAAAQRFLDQALERGHEGVMAKSLDAPYAAGQRGSHWLKLKAAVTLDLVILGAEWGSGRRKGWLSNLHLGARDAESGRYVMLGKTFKGLTDEMLRWQTEKLLALESGRDAYTVYVRPELVAEIAFNEIQESPRYPGGVALRFARVKRYRPERSAAAADTFQTVKELFLRSRGGL
jgi:DNA ligase-1